MMYTKRGERQVFAFILVAICIIFGATGQILMRTGMSQIGPIGGWQKLLTIHSFQALFTNIFVLGGLLLYAISAVLWLGALSNLNVSLIYPLLSLAYVVAAVLSFIFLKESISLLRWIGILVVIIGSYLILRG
jgi:drug/metabolite transporter (DMT)-like permease